MKLRRIQYFVTLCEELHFSRAAERLHITQPSLSEQIRILERDIGVRLLDRGTRSVSITIPGRVFLQKAQILLSTIDEATDATRRAQKGELGVLSIGFIGLTALDTLPQLIKRFRAAYPSIDVVLRECPTKLALEEIRAGRLDIGVVREPAAIRGLSNHVIQRSNHIVVLPADHRLAGQHEIQLGELADEHFIIYSRKIAPAVYDKVMSSCLDAGFTPIIDQEVDQILTILGLVGTGAGIAILPEIVTCLHHDQVTYAKLQPKLSVEAGIVWDGTQVQNPAITSFLELLDAG